MPFSIEILRTKIEEIEQKSTSDSKNEMGTDFYLNLSFQDVTDKDCAEIAAVLKDHTRVRGINIQGNSITEVGIKKLKSIEGLKIINDCPQPTVNEEENIPNEILTAEFLAEISDSEEEVLCLMSMNIDHEGVNKLVKALKNNKYIKEIDLSGNFIGDEGVSNLSVLINRLTILRLDNCLITVRGAEILARAASLPTSCLQILTVNNNLIKDEGIQYFAGNSILERLEASNCGLTLACAPALAKTKLRHLDLSSNKIEDGIGSLLFSTIAPEETLNETLTELILDKNLITNQEIRFLASNKKLALLSLASTLVDDKDPLPFKDLLKNDSLKHLNLFNNRVGSNVARELSISKLETVDLSFNKIDDCGAEGFTKNKESNFLSITLDDNPVSRETREKVSAFTFINKKRKADNQGTPTLDSSNSSSPLKKVVSK